MQSLNCLLFCWNMILVIGESQNKGQSAIQFLMLASADVLHWTPIVVFVIISSIYCKTFLSLGFTIIWIEIPLINKNCELQANCLSL